MSAAGNVHLTERILKAYQAGELKALDEDVVVEYLKSNLKWKVQSGGQELHYTQVNGLEVVCRSVQVEVNPGMDTFDRWVGEFVEYPQVTGS